MTGWPGQSYTPTPQLTHLLARYAHALPVASHTEGMADPEGVQVVSGEEGKTLPLFIYAKEGNDSVDFLKEWIADNKAWLDAKMLQHGKF